MRKILITTYIIFIYLFGTVTPVGGGTNAEDTVEHRETTSFRVSAGEPSEESLTTDNFNNESYEKKKSLMLQEMEEVGLTGEESFELFKIATKESCSNPEIQDCFNTTKVPPTTVYHCKKDGGYFAIELKSVGGLRVQAYCEDYGAVQTGSEKSIGMFQILVSTWQGYECEGQIRDYNWQEQVACAAKIYKTSGFTAWSTFSTDR